MEEWNLKNLKKQESWNYNLFELNLGSLVLISLLVISDDFLVCRETEADRTRNHHSLYRKLDSILYLLVKKPRELHAWQMPQGGLDQGESLIQVS